MREKTVSHFADGFELAGVIAATMSASYGLSAV
jgi:hypothetical protein